MHGKSQVSGYARTHGIVYWLLEWMGAVTREGGVGTEQRWWNDTEHKSSKRGRVKAMNNIGRERQKWMGNTTTATATTIEAS